VVEKPSEEVVELCEKFFGPGARQGELATLRTSARPGVRADSRVDVLEALLRVDAEVKTTLPPSLRRPISRGSAQSATASRGRTA